MNEEKTLDEGQEKQETQETGNAAESDGVEKENGAGQTLEKRFTQEDIDKALENARQKWESEQEQAKNQAEELAGLSEKDRQKRLDEIERQKFNEEKQAFEHERLEFEVKKQLTEKGLMHDFSAYITGKDAAETKEKMEHFESLISKYKQSIINGMMKGAPPKTGASVKGITKEQFEKMTYPERMNLYNTNKDEYDRLIGGNE